MEAEELEKEKNRRETFYPPRKSLRERAEKTSKLILYEFAECDLTETFFKNGNFPALPSPLQCIS